MKFFNKQRSLILIIVFLLITNIATLGTILYHRWIFKTHNDKNEHKVKITKFVQEELNFSEDQMTKFKNYKTIYRLNEDRINDSIFIKRNLVFKELSKLNPDTLKIDSISKIIGNLNVLLYKNVINKYNKVRSLCNDEQKTKLCNLFNELTTKGINYKDK